MMGLLAAVPGLGAVMTALGSWFKFILQCNICMILLGGFIAFSYGDIRGYQRASKACQAHQAQLEAAAARRDAEAAKLAAAAANASNEQLNELASTLQGKVDNYEQAIAKLQADKVACRRATADDVKRLRGIAP